MKSSFTHKHSEAEKIKLQQRLSKGRSVIGIDIGSSSVNVAQMVKYRGKHVLIRTKVVDIAVKHGQSPDDAILHALYDALNDFNLKNAKFSCVVNCPQTCVRKIVMPHMPKSEMRGAVNLEAKRSIPFPLENAVLDFNVMEDVLDKGVEKLSIIVAASPKPTIERLQSFFNLKKSKPFAGNFSKKFESEQKLKPLGLKIAVFLPLPLCLENIIERSKLKIKETLVTLEMGTDVTELNIYNDSRLQFSRKIPFTGKDVTRSLTGALMTDKGKVELTLEEAEQIKKEYGIPRIEDNKIIDGKITTNQVLSLLRPKVEQLAKEIDRSFDFYRDEMHGAKIDRIVLFGGGSQLKGLPEFISNELEVEVNIGNPLEDIEMLFDEVVANESDAHSLVLAIGAALSNMGGINLTPVEAKAKSAAVIPNMFIKFGFVVVLVLLVLSTLGVYLKNQTIKKNYASVQAKYDQLTPQLKELREHSVVGQSLAMHIHWDQVLKEISNTIPSNMYLMNMSMKDSNLILRGVIQQDMGSSETTLSKFMVDLEKGVMKNVSLVKTKKNIDDASMLEFEIKSEVD